jgi:hypothetical protein
VSLAGLSACRDEWDERLLRLLDLICLFLGCPTEVMALSSMSTDLAVEVQAFVTMANSANVDPYGTPEALGQALFEVQEARWIAGTQPVAIPTSLLGDLDAALERIQVAIENTNGAAE